MSERLVADLLRNRMAILGSVAALGGGVAVANTLTAQSASANTPTATGSPESGSISTDRQCYSQFDPNRPPGPQRGCWDSTQDTNADVQLCQYSAIEPAPHGFIASRHFNYKTGSRSVRTTEKLNRLQVWSGNLFLYACAEVTNNKVKEQLVEHVITHSGKRKTKIVGKAVILRGNDSTEFDGNSLESKITKSILKLPVKLNRQDLRRRRWGVKDTILSSPRIQVPYRNPDDPASDVLGPMKTMRKSHITWFHNK